jgi:hypothetical protein
MRGNGEEEVLRVSHSDLLWAFHEIALAREGHDVGRRGLRGRHGGEWTEKHDGGDGTERKRKTRNDGRAGQGRDGPARRLRQGEGRGVESRPRASCHEFRLFLVFSLCLRG